MYPDSSLQLNFETDKAIYFFTSAFEPFDNFSAHAINLWGQTFPTAEHAYQWKKFEVTNPTHAERIRTASSPWAAKQITYELRDYRKDWQKVKLGIMEETLRAKVSQHQDVRDLLLKTSDKIIVENSPVDSFWGAGVDGKGENWIGKIFMKIREELKTDQTVSS